MTTRILSRKKVLITFIAFAVVFYIFCYQDINYFSIFHHRKKYVITKLYTVNTTGCRIPYLEAENEEITKLFQDVSGYTCGIRPLVESNLTSLFINPSVLEDYDVDTVDDVDCSYKPFWRRPPVGTENDVQVVYGTSVHFHSSIDILDEFVRVECKYNNRKYIDYHSFVPLKPTAQDTKRQPSDERLNIIIAGIDSMSRVHLHRKMPKTVRYVNELNAVEFMGYNKLGDNTFPNLMPMLTSYTYAELYGKCWKDYNSTFDNCSFVWTNYTNRGYVTSFAEEESFYGLFNYLKKGWIKQPTDYYWGTLDFQALQELEHWYTGHKDYPICMGSRPMYKVLLSSAEKFITTMTDRKFFSFHWLTSISHNHIDTPSLADEDYVNHLSYINQTGVLNNSLLIFMSDHGHRFGKMAQTHQGHLEDRLPFMFWVFPDWFKKKYQAAINNLKENAFKLMTNFDVHVTLNHILLLDQLSDEKIKAVKVPDERGISLFHPIPEERTCDTAGILPHYCTCQEALPVDKTDKIVLKITEFTVQYLNKLLVPFPNCANLVLDEIVSANLASYGDIYHNNLTIISDYTISFKTSPGGGWFDATIRCTLCNANDFQLAGSVGRLNRYDNQSYCIHDLNLRQYCYCLI